MRYQIAIILFLSFLFVSCRTTKYVPIETVRTEYKEADTSEIYNRILRSFEAERSKESKSDSVIDRIKETIVINDKGDTTRHDRLRYIYVSSKRVAELEREVAEKDSIISNLRTKQVTEKVDSIAVPYPVEKELSRWEKAKQEVGGFCIIVLLAGIIAFGVWGVWKTRKSF